METKFLWNKTLMDLRSSAQLAQRFPILIFMVLIRYQKSKNYGGCFLLFSKNVKIVGE